MQLSSMIRSQYSLLESRPLNRPPLDVWASRVLQGLQTLLERDPTEWSNIGEHLNLAALIEVYRGELEGARRLCEFHLRWAARLSRQHGNSVTGSLAIQPWINVGRLLRIERKFTEANEYFKLFLDHSAKRTLHLGSLEIPQEAWQAILSTKPEVGDVLEVVYLTDSLKTCFAARDYEKALDFIQSCRASDALQWTLFLEEGELIAWLGLERHGEALDVTLRQEWTRTALGRLLSATYRGGVLLLLGEGERARHVLEAVAACVFKSRPETLQNQRLLRILHLLGTCAHQAGLEPTANRVFQLGLQAARLFEDEPLKLAFLDGLLSLKTFPEAREAWEEEREQLLQRSLYLPFLRARGRTVESTPAFAPVFDALRNTLFTLGEA